MEQYEMFCANPDCTKEVSNPESATYVVGGKSCCSMACAQHVENMIIAQEIHLRRAPYFDDGDFSPATSARGG